MSFIGFFIGLLVCLVCNLIEFGWCYFYFNLLDSVINFYWIYYFNWYMFYEFCLMLGLVLDFGVWENVEILGVIFKVC